MYASISISLYARLATLRVGRRAKGRYVGGIHVLKKEKECWAYAYI